MKLPSFHYKYAIQHVKDPFTGETTTIHIPKVPCRFVNGSNVIMDNGVLDSGADYCVINMKMAESLGLELFDCGPMKVVRNERPDHNPS